MSQEEKNVTITFILVHTTIEHSLILMSDFAAFAT